MDMDWGGPFFVIAIVAISTFGWLASSWIRAKHGYPLENEWSGMVDKAEQPGGGPQGRAADATRMTRLKGQVGRLEERIAVLERIATDPAERTAREIEQLR